jgi:threonine/homoserine/homoserine lactone efflux protein
VGWRFLVNLLNPKVAIFVLALVPQFVDPSRGSTVLQFLIFGAILNIGGTIINGLIGAFAGTIGRVLATNYSAVRLFQWLSSGIFFGLAAKLLFDRR